MTPKEKFHAFMQENGDKKLSEVEGDLDILFNDTIKETIKSTLEHVTKDIPMEDKEPEDTGSNGNGGDKLH